MVNELVVIEPATAFDLFIAPDKVQILLSGIREKALAEQALLDTDLSKPRIAMLSNHWPTKLRSQKHTSTKPERLSLMS